MKIMVSITGKLDYTLARFIFDKTDCALISKENIYEILELVFFWNNIFIFLWN
jgi:hypothetical protein